ncbi:MAG: lipopolysaccharide assembly protein LapA domain-containing protein [Chloroflexi bacterium]|nr:lipopolysaccharide assembly protein LapA domain-containing protein [Chloroflexota bacterium]
MSQLIVFLALAFSILIAIFAVSNTEPVEVSFLTLHSPKVAASVLVLISAALGALAMLLLGLAREVSLRWSHRATTQQLKAANARIAQLEADQAAQAPPAAALPSAPALGSVPDTSVGGAESVSSS